LKRYKERLYFGRQRARRDGLDCFCCRMTDLARLLVGREGHVDDLTSASSISSPGEAMDPGDPQRSATASALANVRETIADTGKPAYL